MSDEEIEYEEKFNAWCAKHGVYKDSNGHWQTVINDDFDADGPNYEKDNHD